MGSWGFVGGIKVLRRERAKWLVVFGSSKLNRAPLFANNIIIEMQGYLIVVDANYPDRARKAMTEFAVVCPESR